MSDTEATARPDVRKRETLKLNVTMGKPGDQNRRIKAIRTETPILIWHNVGQDSIERIERRDDITVVWYDIYRAGKLSESINATFVSRVWWDDLVK